ncbi:MAG: sulfatase-like hydrolase/transferase, partial [Planctomycetaceae bacterium]|nr:sulfatase-like hydrolase/transferase [Planctomycetaceae bacterium]
MPGVRSGRLLLSLAGLLLWTVQIANAESQKPNLLIIQTDEHHFGTLGAYGSTMFGGEGSLTPHLDQLADGGAVATSFYATTPVCSPSRSSLMTGHYPQQTPVVTNDVPMSGQLQTFADLLKSAGYATGYSGKWHLDGDGKPQWAPQRNFGWSDNRYMFNRGHWKKLVLGENGPEVGSLNAKQEPSYGLDGADEKTFTTDWLADRAIEFVREHAQEPFCYMVSLPDPHGPNTVRAPYDTMYSADDVVIPASLQKTNEQIPEWGQPDRNVNEEMLKKQMPEYFGMVKCIDDNIGRILKTLDEMKIREKTMIVFTSDHGDLCGEHGKVNKGNPYEGSARIPFILNYPGVVPAGTQVDVALSCVDFLPTILDLMSCPNHLKVPGRNAADWFRGQTPDNWQDVTFLRSTSGQKVWL